MFINIRKYIPSIITAALGIVILLIIPSQIDISRVNSSNATGINSRTIPYFLAISIVLLSILELFIKKIRGDCKDTATERVQIQYMAYMRVFLTFVGIILWIVLIPYLGFVITMILLLLSIMLLMGNRNWLQLILIPLLISFTLSYVFTEFVGRTLPSGIFF